MKVPNRSGGTTAHKVVMPLVSILAIGAFGVAAPAATALANATNSPAAATSADDGVIGWD